MSEEEPWGSWINSVWRDHVKMVVLSLSKYIDTSVKSYFNPTTFCIQQWRTVNDSKRHQSYADSLLLGTLANINNTTQWQIVYIWLKGKRCILLYSLTMLLNPKPLTNIFQIVGLFNVVGSQQWTVSIRISCLACWLLYSTCLVSLV